jgi:hypothetical protein
LQRLPALANEFREADVLISLFHRFWCARTLSIVAAGPGLMWRVFLARRQSIEAVAVNDLQFRLLRC